MLVAMAVAGALGLAFERFIIRPVYGQHLKQILITMGGMIISEELIKVIWGPAQIALPLPEALRGSVLLGDAAIEKYRLLAVLVGLLVFTVLAWVLSRTQFTLASRSVFARSLATLAGSVVCSVGLLFSDWYRGAVTGITSITGIAGTPLQIDWGCTSPFLKLLTPVELAKPEAQLTALAAR